MDDQGFEVVFLAKRTHRLALRFRQRIGLPLARARRKYLEGRAAQAIRTLSGSFYAAGGRGVNADATRGARWRSRRRGRLEDVLLLGHGPRHYNSNSQNSSTSFRRSEERRVGKECRSRG